MEKNNFYSEPSSDILSSIYDHDKSGKKKLLKECLIVEKDLEKSLLKKYYKSKMT